MTNIRRIAGASVAWAALSSQIPPAVAQQAEIQASSEPEDAEIRLKSVTVSAQKKEESLQDVPIAVTVIDASELANTQVAGNLELGEITPGLVTIEGSGFFIPYIRGIGTRAITPGNESPVAFYTDGVYQTDKVGLLLAGFNDVESIQVLRGPQGTLFGRNATAGAVLVETKMPGDTFELDAKLTYGSDEFSGALFVAGPLVPTLSGSVATFFKNEDPYIRNLNPSNGAGGEVGETEASGVRAKLLWQPTSNFSALLDGNYVDSTDEAPWAVQAIQGTGLTAAEAVAAAQSIPIPDIRNQRPVYAGEVPPEVNAEGTGISLTMDLSLDAFDVQSITAWRKDLSSGYLDLDGTPVPLFWFLTSLESDVWQQEINITSNSTGPLSWQVGAYYMDLQDGYASLNQHIGMPFPYSDAALASLPAGSLRSIQQSNVFIESFAVFGEAYYDLTDRTGITLGIRYTDEEHEIDPSNQQVVTVPDGMGGVTDLPTVTPAQVCNADPDCDGLTAPFEEITWRAVLDHKFSPDTLGYVSYNRGFKSGVYNISTISNTQATEPEIIDAFEIGLKSTILNGRLALNAAIYYNEYQDLQVPVTAEGETTQSTINAASATTSGLEVEARWQATSQLFLSGGFSTFFKSEYDSFDNCSVFIENSAGNTQVNGDCSGQDMPATPDYTFNISGEYAVPLASGAEVRLNGLFRYSDEFDFAPYASPDTRAPAQQPIETLNLSGTWSAPGNHYYLTVWGRNLLDPDDVYRGVFTTPFGYSTTYARGSTYGVTAGVRY